MGRLSMDREERTSQMREWETDLSTEHEERTETVVKSSGGASLTQIVIGVFAVIGVIVLLPWAWHLLISLLLWLVRSALRLTIGVALVAAVLWLLGKFLKKR